MISVPGQSFCGIATLVAAFDPDASFSLAESPLLIAVPADQHRVGSPHFVTVTVCDRVAGSRVQG